MKSVPFVTALLLVLAGCSGGLCPEASDLEEAARYYVRSEGGYSKPLNTWVDNPKLEAFLRDALRRGGIQGLRVDHGLECTQHLSCADCWTCARTLPISEHEWVLSGPVCRRAGELLIHADIGPGPSVRAMTYWNRKE